MLIHIKRLRIQNAVKKCLFFKTVFYTFAKNDYYKELGN